MNNLNIQNNIEADILKKIECGEVKMKPKSYFILKASLMVLVTFATFVTTTLLVSFLVFSLIYRGDLFLLSFGVQGVYKFILVFPWYLLLVNAFLLIFLDYLVRRFKFGYNSPLIYLFLGTLVFVTLFSFLINFTSFHIRLSNYFEEKKVPFARDLYRNVSIPSKARGAFRGYVTFVGENYIMINSPGIESEIKVYSPIGSNIVDMLEIGDEVYIASNMASGTDMISFGIKTVKHIR